MAAAIVAAEDRGQATVTAARTMEALVVRMRRFKTASARRTPFAAKHSGMGCAWTRSSSLAAASATAAAAMSVRAIPGPALAVCPMTLAGGPATVFAIATAPAAGIRKTAAVDRDRVMATVALLTKAQAVMTPASKTVFVPRMPFAVSPSGTTYAWVKSKNSAVEIVAGEDLAPEAATAARPTTVRAAMTLPFRTACAHKTRFAVRTTGTTSVWVK